MMTTFGSSTNGLGDTLLLTALCKYFPKEFTIQIPTDCERFKILFDGIANVEVTDQCALLTDDPRAEHYTTRKLYNFFDHAGVLDNRPLVLHTNEESERWAQEYLNDKPNPIIFVPNCSKRWHHVRSLPEHLREAVLRDMKNSGITPILVTSSSNPCIIGGIPALLDLDLSKYICLLRRVGHYIGCNTGDEHLATAVGCRTLVFQPEQSGEFNPKEWNYRHVNSEYRTWK